MSHTLYKLPRPQNSQAFRNLPRMKDALRGTPYAENSHATGDHAQYSCSRPPSVDHSPRCCS